MKEVIRMKKLNRILSSVLVVSLLISCFAMNVFAASKAHTVTIKPEKTEGLKAGDTLVIELIMDNTEKLVSCMYKLTYDTTAFSADTTKVSRLENCIDKTWLDGMKDTDGDWGYYLGNPTYNVATAGEMQFAWAGSQGVEADYAIDNRVIGKFNLIVKDGVADGTYTFSLTGNTMDSGENAKADMVTVPVTVTVGEGGSTTVAEEEFTVVDTAPTEAEYTFDGDKKVTLEDGATQLAVFGKNASKGLAAYDYGIIVGGVEFPGIADVPENSYWCIKLVAPKGVDADGNTFEGAYKVKSFIKTAEGTIYGTEVTANVQ